MAKCSRNTYILSFFRDNSQTERVAVFSFVKPDWGIGVVGFDARSGMLVFPVSLAVFALVYL